MIQLKITLKGPATAGGGKTQAPVEVSRDLNLGATVDSPDDLEKLKATWSNLIYNQIELLNCALFEAFKAAAKTVVEPPAEKPAAPVKPAAVAKPTVAAVETKPNGKQAAVQEVREVQGNPPGPEKK